MTLTVFLPILEESAYKKSLKGYSGLCLYLPRKIKGMNVFKKHNDEQLSGPNCSSITYGFSPQLQALHRNTIQRNESASLKKKKKAPSSAITSMGGHILLLWAKTTAKCSPYPQLEGSGRRPKRSGKAESLPRAVRWQASKQNKKLVTSASQKWCVPGPQEDFFPQPFTLQ